MTDCSGGAPVCGIGGGGAGGAEPTAGEDTDAAACVGSVELDSSNFRFFSSSTEFNFKKKQNKKEAIYQSFLKKSTFLTR